MILVRLRLRLRHVPLQRGGLLTEDRACYDSRNYKGCGMSADLRADQITQALAAYQDLAPGAADTDRIPFRSSSRILPVIELPVGIPVLNTDSFRIAPLLEDHPSRESILADPESAESQQIVSGMVRRAHRHADDLKNSLRAEGQDTAGLITRSGKLINANTRCVLLRELFDEGVTSASTIRVAVLPPDTTNGEELGLESVLQQQQEHKDEYNLVSKLMMINKLHSEGGMSDRAIATSLRETKGAKRIKELREVLALMHRARALTAPAQPITSFVSEKSQQQNWLELLRDVNEIEKSVGRSEADEHIRGWLLAYYNGESSVHILRSARDQWVMRDVLPELKDGDEIGKAIAADSSLWAQSEPDQSGQLPVGVDLLAEDSEVKPSTRSVTERLLDLTVTSLDRKDEKVLVNGRELEPQEVAAVVKAAVRVGLDSSSRRTAGQNRMARPKTLVEQAAKNLRSALQVLADVDGDVEFASYRSSLESSLEGITTDLERLRSRLETEGGEA